MPLRLPSQLGSPVPIALTAVVLGAIFADRLLFHTPPAEAATYHQRVADAAHGLPMFIDNWLGSDADIPPAAVKLLHPNVSKCRRYRNVTTGRTITFLLIQCRDARDLVGHYPPICYVNQGWSLESAVPLDASVGGVEIKATRYGFASKRIGQLSALQVDNFMVLPTGETCPDMNGIYAAAKDPQKKFFGAAQVQFVCDADIPAAERAGFEQNLLHSARPLFEEIRKGVRR